MRKHYVLDTNVLVHDPQNALSAFQENHVVIPIIVTEELDRLKHDANVGFDAREISRQLETFRTAGNIAIGVPMENGGTIRIDANKLEYSDLPLGFEKKPDNIILLNVKRLQKKFHSDRNGEKVTLVTKDINLRLKANAMEIHAEDYESDKVSPSDKLYTGVVMVPVTHSDISELHREGYLAVPNDSSLISTHLRTLPPNVCCVLNAGIPGVKENSTTALAIYKKTEERLVLVEKANARKTRKAGITPRNDMQCFAYDLMMSRDISLLTFVGKAGTGKTLMALLAGIELLHKKRFEKIIVFRPNVEVGEPLGFLPGDIEEKFEPWARPVVDCLNFALTATEDTAETLFAKGQLEILPFNYIRGATYRNALVIVDETQNLTPHIVKTAITRMGDGSMMVLNGDVTQIDNRFLDERSNGLSNVQARFPGQDLYGHLTFTKSERSRLAELAATLL